MTIALKAIPRPPTWAVLACVLVLSLGLNLWQAKAKWEADATAPLEAKIDDLEVTAKVEDKVSELRKKDEAELAKLRDAIPTKVGKAKTVYRERIVKVPVPTCPPGQDRVDEWNAAGQKELQ